MTNVQKHLFTVMIIALFSAPVLIFKMKGFTFLFNRSDSLNGFVFVMKSFKEGDFKTIKKGDIVVIVHKLYQSTPILKKVSHLEEEDYFPLSKVKTHHLLTRDTFVPKDHIAVIGEHERSYDSRFKGFGFVPLINVKGLAWRIF